MLSEKAKCEKALREADAVDNDEDKNLERVKKIVEPLTKKMEAIVPGYVLFMEKTEFVKKTDEIAMENRRLSKPYNANPVSVCYKCGNKGTWKKRSDCGMEHYCCSRSCRPNNWRNQKSQ